MGRKAKYPNHEAEAQSLMNSLLDELVALWTSEENPELKAVSDELEMSAAKVRKLLITAGERDKTTYYESPVADQILVLYHSGKTAKEIEAVMNLSRSSVAGYLPHSKIVYSLDTMSSEAERIKVFRFRKAAVEALQAHAGLPDENLWLWKTVIAFENYPFQTSGRGSRPGTRFSYTVSHPTTAGGRRYEGESVDGYGNEIWIDGKEKSISRSTVELGYRRAVEAGGMVKGPKALGLPGAGSYVYSMLVRFGIIKKNTPDEQT